LVGQNILCGTGTSGQVLLQLLRGHCLMLLNHKLFLVIFKVVRREICAVVTKGTLTDGERLITNPDSSYLMSITESPIERENEKETVIGICLVDVSTGKFVVGQVFICYNPSFYFNSLLIFIWIIF
jgi:hypothetical protein